MMLATKGKENMVVFSLQSSRTLLYLIQSVLPE